MDTDIRGSLSNSLERLIAFIPSLIAGLVVLLLGYVIGKILAKVTHPLLHRVGFDRLLHRMRIIEDRESQAGSSGAASLVFALVVLGAIMQTARIWELELVSTGLARLFAYLPHVLGAVVIFGVAMWFGNWARDRILRRSGDPTVTSGDEKRLAAAAVRAAVLTLGAFMALRELQVGAQIVTIGFTLALGAIAVATALAFGLGSREVAGRAMQRWYDRGTRSGSAGPPPTSAHGGSGLRSQEV